MEIFGIGPLELILIIFIAIIVLGPTEMVETAKKTATWLRKLRQSDIWKTTKDVMDLPNQVMKETGLDKEIREINALSKKTIAPISWEGDPVSYPPALNADDPKGTENPSDQTIAPPKATPASSDKEEPYGP
jgi:Sec-independent protein translocase protein TatA